MKRRFDKQRMRCSRLKLWHLGSGEAAANSRVIRRVSRKLTPRTQTFWDAIFIYSKKHEKNLMKFGNILEQYIVSYTTVLQNIINLIHPLFLSIFICYQLRKVSNKLTPNVNCPVRNTDIRSIRFYFNTHFIYILIPINDNNFNHKTQT